MTLEKFYEKIGGNYADTISRLMTEERILRFVRKFPADDSFNALKDALVRGSQEEAFRAAHTLKGVAQNLGFTALYEKASAVTEVLRGGSLDVAALMPDLESVYRLTVDGIADLD
ncbi:MAG: Hpt domain-containing protein [Clostridia bacterium]|nr:Hpt domain-containing protein [Clostridia bacterium]